MGKALNPKMSLLSKALPEAFRFLERQASKVLSTYTRFAKVA